MASREDVAELVQGLEKRDIVFEIVSRKPVEPEHIAADDYGDEIIISFADGVTYQRAIECLEWFKSQYPDLYIYTKKPSQFESGDTHLITVDIRIVE